MPMSGELIIQPVGGFTGAGAPGAKFHSEGRLPVSSLSEPDRARIDELFAKPATEMANFYYRITLESPEGTRTIEVPPETVPKTLIDSIRTTLD